jgi:hypothetical protein
VGHEWSSTTDSWTPCVGARQGSGSAAQAGGDAAVPGFVRETMRSQSEPLAPGLRAHFEPHFGSGLHDVRIHCGREARAASLALGARAFAVGDHIAWPSSAPAMDSSSGRGLLAHELAHVMQQRGGPQAGAAAGGPEAERQARAAADGHALRHTPAALTATRPGLALSVEEFIDGLPDLSTRSYSQLVDDIDQINEWMGRQISTTPESTQLEAALAGLRAEVAKRNKNVAAKTVKPLSKPKGRQKQAAAPDPVPDASQIPRVLKEQSTIVYRDAEERKEELDKVVAWMQRSDVSKSDRQLLRMELADLAPDFDKDRAKGAGERRSQVIQQAIGLPSDGNTAGVVDALRRIDEIKPLSGEPGVQYMMKGTEMIRMSDQTVAELRAKTGSALDKAASDARSMNEYTFGRAQDFIKVNDDRIIVSFVVSKWSGLDPYDMWDQVLPLIQGSNTAVTRFRDMRKANASLASEAAQVFQALQMAQQARQTFNRTFDGAMNAADQIVNRLKVVVAVSAAVELALVAAIAAPVVAAGVSGLGVTGAMAGGLTIAGTSGVTAVAGAGIGYTSTRLEGGSVEEAKANSWKMAKQGAVTGLGAGTTQVLGTAFGVGASGVSTAGNVVRSTAAQMGGNFVANATGTALEGGSASDSLKSGLIGVGTAAVAAPLGAAANSIEAPAARALANMAVSGGVGFGAGYALSGGDTDQALQAAVISTATAGVMSKLQTGPTWRQQKAYDMGRGLANTSRSALAATMLGVSNPNLPFRGTGATVSGTILEPVSGIVANRGGTPAATPSEAVTAAQAVQANAPAPAPVPTTQTAASVPSAVPPAVAPASPAGASTQAAGVIAATNAAVMQNQNAHPDDQAFDENTAAFQGGNRMFIPLRQRVTGSGNRQTSLATLAHSPEQRQAARAIIGQRMSGGLLAAWNATTNARETADMARVALLWNQGTPASQQQARVLARKVFDRHVGRFGNRVRGDATLRAEFTRAGMRFDLTASGLPRYRLPSGEETGITLDHVTRLSDDPTMALTGLNLSFVLGDENSVTLEFIRNNDPFQR